MAAIDTIILWQVREEKGSGHYQLDQKSDGIWSPADGAETHSLAKNGGQGKIVLKICKLGLQIY